MSPTTPFTPDTVLCYRHAPGATDFIRTYTDKARYFALNRYVTFDTVTAADLTPDPGWDEKTGERNPSPGGTKRHTYCYPFQVANKDGPVTYRPEDSILAEHAAAAAAKAVTVRVLIGLELLKRTRPFAEAVRVADTGRAAVESAVLSLGITHTKILCNPRGAQDLLDGKYNKHETQFIGGAELAVDHVVGEVLPERKYAWPSDLIVVCRGPLLRYRFLKYSLADDEKNLSAGVRLLGPASEDREIEMRMCVELKGNADGRIVEDYLVELCDPSLVRVILK